MSIQHTLDTFFASHNYTGALVYQETCQNATSQTHVWPRALDFFGHNIDIERRNELMEAVMTMYHLHELQPGYHADIEYHTGDTALIMYARAGNYEQCRRILSKLDDEYNMFIGERNYVYDMYGAASPVDYGNRHNRIRSNAIGVARTFSIFKLLISHGLLPTQRNMCSLIRHGCTRMLSYALRHARATKNANTFYNTTNALRLTKCEVSIARYHRCRKIVRAYCNVPVVTTHSVRASINALPDRQHRKLLCTLLKKASKHHDFKTLAQLKRFADTIVKRKKQPLLYHAIAFGDMQIVYMLLKYCKVRSMCVDGVRPIELAKNIDMFESLLGAGARLTARSLKSFTEDAELCIHALWRFDKQFRNPLPCLYFAKDEDAANVVEMLNVPNSKLLLLRKTLG